MKKIISVFCLFALLVGLCSCSMPLTYANAALYTAGDAEITDPVSSIELHWPSGTVSVTVGTGDTLTVTETNADNLSDAKKLHWLMNDGKLTVYYCAAGEIVNFTFWTKAKDLTVTLPAGCELNDAEIDTASGTVSVRDLKTENLTISTASGKTDVIAAVSNKVEIGSASGTVKFENTANCKRASVSSASGHMDLALLGAEALEAKSASGRITLYAKEIGNAKFDTASGGMDLKIEKIENGDFESASGTIRLSLPETQGFNARLDMASGKFSTELPVTESGKYRRYGDGSANLSIDLASGDFRIFKLN